MEKFSYRYFCTEDEANEYLSKFGDEVDGEIGSGEWGTTFQTVAGKVVKCTTSEDELQVASGLVGHGYANVVDIYDVEGKFIYMELLHHDESVEYMFYEMMNMIDEVNTDFGHLDVDEYIEETGNDVGPEMRKFIEEMEGVIIALSRMGLLYSNDTHSDNLARSENGTLKIFDIMPRGGSQW